MDNFLFLPRALAAALFDIAFAAAFGLVLSSLWLHRKQQRAMLSKLRRMSILCGVAMLVALAAQAYLLIATMAGSAAFPTIRAQAASVIADTHAGRVLVLNVAVSLIFLVLLPLRQMRHSRTGAYSCIALLALLAATRSAIGHSAGDGDFTLPELVQFVHLTAIAIWSGGVMAAGLFVLPATLRGGQIEAMSHFTRRLSKTVTIALLLVVSSGIYNSWRGLGGDLHPLAGTQWGLLLDVKVLLVCAALTLGAFSRRLLGSTPNLVPAQATRLVRLQRAGAAVMLLILTVSAFLGNSPPANPG
jgi:putative copper resistance protein D